MEKKYDSNIPQLMWDQRKERSSLVALGMSYDTAARIHQGHLNFNFQTALKLADLFGVTLDDLVIAST